jgi:hypothetical protein
MAKETKINGNKRVGKMSERRKEKHGKILRRSCEKTETDEKGWLSDHVLRRR